MFALWILRRPSLPVSIPPRREQYSLNEWSVNGLWLTFYRFNRTLFRLRGQAMGAEHKGKGVHVALGPMMNMGYAVFFSFLLVSKTSETKWSLQPYCARWEELGGFRC